MPIPTSLVAPIRAALESQGFPAQSITPSGDLDPVMLLSGAFRTIEIRTSVTPPFTFNVSDLSDQVPSGPIPRLLKPTIVLRGPAGSNTIAAFGEASPAIGWVVFLGIVGALVGIGYLIGKAS